MQKKSTNLKKEKVVPSDYTINFILNFSKSIKIIELKTLNKIFMYCN